MAYEKQTWTCGDTITADKLNHIEDGIANGWGDTLVVTLDSDGYTDKTVKEINDAFNTGQRVVIMKPYNQLPYSMSTAEILCAVGQVAPNGTYTSLWTYPSSLSPSGASWSFEFASASTENDYYYFSNIQ